MRKIFFFGALLISAMSFAQVNWYDQIELQNTAPVYLNNQVGSTAYEEVYANEAGDIFLVGKSASAGLDPHSVVLGNTIETVPFRPNMAQTNTSPFFAKVNAKGETQWLIYSQDGNFNSYTALGLEDGSMLVAATACQTNQNVYGLLQLNSTNKASYALSKTYYGFLMKIAADGKPTILAKVTQADGKNNITFNHMVTDGTNFYVLAVLKGAVSIEGTELAPAHAGGSLAVLKFNEAGAYQGAVQTSGIAVTASTADLHYADNKLYITCSLGATEGAELKIGEAKTTLSNDLKNIIVFVANDDLSGNTIYRINGLKESNKNTITTYATAVADGKIYISGFYAGGIDAEGVPATTTNKAFVVSMNLVTRATKGLQLPCAGTGINGVQANGMLQKGDSLYAYYYDWSATGDRVFLQAIGKDMKLGSRLPLVNTKAQVNTRGFAFQGNNLVYTIYTAKGTDHKLSADNSIVFNTPTSAGVVVSQKIFDGATGVEEVNAAARASKQLHQGQVYILSGDAIYDIKGQKIQ